ncbi:methionyl-tRNA formyltransferase [Candidatus Saganbacteria bacterium]|nr:methionyl-tRNA formyltransferase [Candidatus Saganbacteria bacterium]
MKLIFFGTPQPAADMLGVLIKAGHKILGVVTQPDRPQGRGRQIDFSPVKQLALEHKLSFEQPERIKNNQEFFDWLKALQPEVIVVVAYGNILPTELLDIPKYGCLNLHASLLPKYRGAAPIQYALLKGEKETGMTVMKMNQGLDTGDILLQQKVKIDEDDNSITLSSKLFEAGGLLLLAALEKITDGIATYQPQDEQQATYAPTIEKENGLIDWHKSATAINNQIRAFNPWPAAYTTYKNQPLKIFCAKVLSFNLSGQHYPAGTVVTVMKDEGIVVTTGEGQLLLCEVQQAGSKRLSAYAFALGHDVKCGEVLPS